MNWPRRLLPHPLLSALLLISWLWLNDTLAPGHVLLGALLALVIPMFTRRFWPEPLSVRHPLKVAEYLLVVLWDIVVANLQVAALILGPSSRLRPGYVAVPLELRSEFGITVLALTVTLTPGTVSVGIERAGEGGAAVLFVHCLRIESEAAVATTIKSRYEARLREIFEC
jgi:multicomponent K+:H+ antiporter subunit E